MTGLTRTSGAVQRIRMLLTCSGAHMCRQRIEAAPGQEAHGKAWWTSERQLPGWLQVVPWSSMLTLREVCVGTLDMQGGLGECRTALLSN